MMQTAVHFLFARFIPGGLLALMLVLATYSVGHSVHANLLSWLWIPSQLSIDDVPLYRLSAAATAEEPIRVGWLGERSLHTLSGYKSQGAADDYLENAFDAYPLARHWTRYLTPGFNNSVLPVQERAGFRLWRPAQQGYKQLIHRTQQGTFVDQSVQRQYAQPDVAFESIRAGRLSVPTDPFGGVYLLTRQAPEARLAAFGVLDAPILSTFDPAAQLLLAEVWALDHHQWAYVPGWSFLLAALTALVPWWVLGRVTRLWLWSGLLVLANGALLLVLLRQVQVLYPLTVPLLSTGLAWLWMKRGLLYRQQWALLTTQYREVTGLWLGHLLDEGKPDAALRYLSEQDPSRWSSELWQLVARGFERSRHYNQAVDCYRTILTFEPLNGPAKRQLKQLTELIDGTRTLALGQGKGELPVGQVENLSLGRYRISIELGRGAMGVVYQAEDPKIHRQVALKVVHLKSLGLDEVEQVKERFFREAQAAGKLNHPNIVTVYDVGEEHDVAYIAMDLLIGKPLSFYVPTHGPIDLVKMVRWAAQAADALGYAHDHEVIHRDVKPANMIIEDRDGRLKLTDFGIARIAGAGQTQTGIVLGSPSYMSPEQIRGETLTGKTDIFSLGVTLYQCITGKLPFTGETLPALAYAITQGKLESPRALNTDVPVSLVRIVNKMLHKDVTERYATAGDLAYSLNRWISDHK